MQFQNISKAARHLNLTHSTVSLQIKSLEDDLGVRLFERRGPVITPTKDAEMLYRMAVPHVEGIQALHETFSSRKRMEDEHTLSVAANNATLNFIVPKILTPYFKQHPDMHVNVHFAEQNDGLKKLLDEEIDVLILPHRAHLPLGEMFRYQPMFYYDPVLLTLPTHPLSGKKGITVEEISRYEFTLPAPGLHVIPNLYDIFRQEQIDKKFRVNFVGWEVTRKYIEAGLVISISADIVLEKDDAIVGTSLSHFLPRVHYGFITLKGKSIPQKVHRLIAVSEEITEGGQRRLGTL